MDLDFSEILPKNLSVAIKIEAAKSLVSSNHPARDLELSLEGSKYLEKLISEYEKILEFVENSVKRIAPNLSEVVGITIASKLISAAGGLEELSRIPACNIQVMGSKKAANLGQSKQGQSEYYGYFGELPEVKKASQKFKTKIVKMFSN